MQMNASILLIVKLIIFYKMKSSSQNGLYPFLSTRDFVIEATEIIKKIIRTFDYNFKNAPLCILS